MSRLKIITSAQMCKLLGKLGFAVVRQKGSHRFYQHADGRTTVIPMHAVDLDRGLIANILKDIDISVDEYNDEL